MRPFYTLITVVLCVLVSSGCSRAVLVHLNDPARSKHDVDVANLLQPRDIPYEVQSNAGMSVGYNLFWFRDPTMTGYRLTLVLRNDTDNQAVFVPEVSVRTAKGHMLQPETFEGLMSRAASLAQTSVPPADPAGGADYYHQGTITSTTGQSYRYSGTSTSGSSFASGFGQGYALGMAIRAARERRAGQLMLQWASTYWMRKQYRVPPKSSVVGALMFPAASISDLPITITIDVSGMPFEFMTVHKRQ